jgi:hypothetical protein
MAGMFARIFLRLRDGQDGQIFRVQRNTMVRLHDGQVVSLKDYREQGGEDFAEIVKDCGDIVARIIPVQSDNPSLPDKQSKFEAEVRRWMTTIASDDSFQRLRVWVDRPVFPRRDLWERWKNAHSAEEMQRVSAQIAGWMREDCHPRWGKELLCHSAALFHAKETLWTYPRSDRATSEKKRAEFFGKALAGLICGIAPATALKHLSRWSPFTPLPPAPPPIRARGPNCPHCGADEVKGFKPGTVVRCACDGRYYIWNKRWRKP